MIEIIDIDSFDISDKTLYEKHFSIKRELVLNILNICNKNNINAIIVNWKIHNIIIDSFIFKKCNTISFNDKHYLVGTIYNISIWVDDHLDDNVIYMYEDLKKKRLNKLNNILSDEKIDQLEMIKIINYNDRCN